MIVMKEEKMESIEMQVRKLLTTAYTVAHRARGIQEVLNALGMS